MLLHAFEEHKGRGHSGEDAAEDTSHLKYWCPRVVVVLSGLLLGSDHRKDDDDDEHPFAEESEIEWCIMSAHCWDILCIDEHSSTDDTEQPKDVDMSAHLDWLDVGIILLDVALWLFLIVISVDAEVCSKEEKSSNSPFRCEVEEPCELCTLLEEKEQRWVAKRCEQTTAVGYDGNEEKDGVNLVLALRDSLDEHTHEEHCGTGGSHE